MCYSTAWQAPLWLRLSVVWILTYRMRLIAVSAHMIIALFASHGAYHLVACHTGALLGALRNQL